MRIMPLVPGFSSRLSVTLGPLAIVGAALTVSAGSVTTRIGVSLVSPTASVGRHFLQLSFLLGPELSPFRCVSPGPLLETCPLSTTSQPFLRLRLDRRCHTLTQTNHNLGSQTLWNLHTNTRPSHECHKNDKTHAHKKNCGFELTLRPRFGDTRSTPTTTAFPWLACRTVKRRKPSSRAPLSVDRTTSASRSVSC